ncbi:DUF937 domain-containing protein [Fusobacterium sp. PH5-44]|uniref:DUF937 domain-containing protein n=1 Tax=unclassified Fusobacterium TaxID=2648384 RepID=UPI003D2407D7
MSSLLESIMNSMLSHDATNTISEKSGVENEQVSNLVSSALPLLLKSMLNNSSNETGANSLADALSTHADKARSSKDILKNPDTNDGNKILNHLFGENTNHIEQSLAKSNNLSLSQVQSVLSIMAPALMNKLGRETKNVSAQSGIGIASILSQLASGFSNKQDSQNGGLDLGSLINFALKDGDGNGKSDLLETLSGLFGKK